MLQLPDWFTYTVLRLGLIAVPLVLFRVLGVSWVIATVASVAIGFCLSYVLLRTQREQVARRLAEIGDRDGRTIPSREDLVEDALVETAPTTRRRRRIDEDDEDFAVDGDQIPADQVRAAEIRPDSSAGDAAQSTNATPRKTA